MCATTLSQLSLDFGAVCESVLRSPVASATSSHYASPLCVHTWYLQSTLRRYDRNSWKSVRRRASDVARPNVDASPASVDRSRSASGASEASFAFSSPLALHSPALSMTYMSSRVMSSTSDRRSFRVDDTTAAVEVA